MLVFDLRDSVRQLEADERRRVDGFSPDLDAYHRKLFAPGVSRLDMASHINEWLLKSRHPCQFARIAAGRSRHRYCILLERDLDRGDSEISSIIQTARQNWKSDALLGKTSSLIVALLSERVAYARSDLKLRTLAEHLCRRVSGMAVTDVMLADEVAVQSALGVRRWQAGISYFASQADGRWWHDHRFPGGMAFSINSIGHMAALRTQLGPREIHESLTQWALPRAMRTIKTASRRGMLRCTWLRLRSADDSESHVDFIDPTRRVTLLGSVARFSACSYEGVYHTDYTLPASYFEEVLQPERTFSLSFSYLHAPSDADFHTIGLGVLDAKKERGS
jgi:hypothetical protein